MLLKKNGVEKKVATGYSWKSLFFGIFYPIVRGDMEGCLYQFLLAFFTFSLSWFIVPFNYNRRYLKRLKADGWKFRDGYYEDYLIA